jgi:hypothetical protein
MTTRAPSPGQLEQSFARVNQLQAELERKERAIGRKVQVLAKGLAGLMEPGAHLHRSGVGLHAFDADGAVCLAAAYLEPEGDNWSSTNCGFMGASLHRSRAGRSEA